MWRGASSVEKGWIALNFYVALGARRGSSDAHALAERLAKWHDAMVAHERHLSTGLASMACDEDCPHAQAPALWAEALATYGVDAHELSFLRTRSMAKAA